MGKILMDIREELRPSNVHLTLPDKTPEEEMITQTQNHKNLLDATIM